MNFGGMNSVLNNMAEAQRTLESEKKGVKATHSPFLSHLDSIAVNGIVDFLKSSEKEEAENRRKSIGQDFIRGEAYSPARAYGKAMEELQKLREMTSSKRGNNSWRNKYVKERIDEPLPDGINTNPTYAPIVKAYGREPGKGNTFTVRPGILK